MRLDERHRLRVDAGQIQRLTQNGLLPPHARGRESDLVRPIVVYGKTANHTVNIIAVRKGILKALE